MNAYKFAEIEVGMEVSFQEDITLKKCQEFLDITEDINPLHNDLNYALDNGYPDKVLWGGLTSSFLSTLAGVYLPGKYSLILSEEIIFKKPVFLNDSPLEITGKVLEKNEEFKYITILFGIYNNKREKVSRGTMKVRVLK